MTVAITTLRDAMAAISRARDLPDSADSWTLGLACSFTPLHLQTYLHAVVQDAEKSRRVQVAPGLYGSLPESIQHVVDQSPDICAVFVEWADLDPRLGVRESATAKRADLEDIATTAQACLDRIVGALSVLAAVCPVAVVLPTLELPYSYAAAPLRVGALEARLNVLVAEFAERLVALKGVRVVAPDGISRRDLQSDLRSGFPYTSARAADIAAAVGTALVPPPPMKGLITDLDDTLWRGLVGEVGPDAVTWDLDAGSLVHGLYQQLLAELARRGVLLGISSKNDPDVVAEAMKRPDLLVPADAVFPVEASWGPKSAAIGRILAAWNISADSVVFVDDNDLELAEAVAAHPGLVVRKFPTQDPRAANELLAELHGLFWRAEVTAEDGLRLASLRASAGLADARDQAQDPVEFLRGLGGQIEIDDRGAWESDRAVELVNKTNQFNLNGTRVASTQWKARADVEGALAWSIGYTDKFGTLGTISVLSGRFENGVLALDTWVLSCRAFSRGIEYHVLDALIARYRPERLVFAFTPTERNGVLARLLSSLGYTSEDATGVAVDDLDLAGFVGIHDVAYLPH